MAFDLDELQFCRVCGTLLTLKSSSGALEDAWMNKELMTLAQGIMNNYLNPFFQPIGDAPAFLNRGILLCRSWMR